MSRTARVQSTDALKAFRPKLIRFADTVKLALADTDAELLRAGVWLRQDRQPYWKAELRRRGELFQRAKSALNEKRLYTSATGARQSSVEEEKAFAIAKRRLEDAEEKSEAVKAWLRRLEDERFLYKAQSQRMARAVEIDVPRAVAKLDRLLDSLDSYFHESAPAQSGETAGNPESVARDHGEASPQYAEAVEATQRSECAMLRKTSPRPAERDAVPPGETALDWPDTRGIPAGQLRALAALEIESRPADGDDIVVIDKRTASAPRVFLERIRTSTPGDSGWYVGPVDSKATIDDCMAVTLHNLINARPDWADLLALPAGSFIIENENGIEYLCDASDAPTLLIVDEDDDAQSDGAVGDSAKGEQSA